MRPVFRNLTLLVGGFVLAVPISASAQPDPFVSYGVSGFYEMGFSHIDVHPDNTVDYDDGGGGCGPSAFYDKGTCFVRDSSTITIIYSKDSVRITYKIIREQGIAEEGPQDTIAMHTREGRSRVYVSRTYIYYRNVWKKTKGYYPDGRKRWEVNDNNKVINTINGPYIGYFQSGKISEKGTIKDGKREGKWVYYDAAGKKTRVAHFKKSVLRKERVL